ncbi:MAG: hypothetical protein ACTHON_08100, partial [Humibacter sp.]
MPVARYPKPDTPKFRVIPRNSGEAIVRWAGESRSGPHDGGVDIDALVDASDPVPWALHAGVITEAEAAELASGDGASQAK